MKRGAMFYPIFALPESSSEDRWWFFCRTMLILLGIWLVFAWSPLGFLRIEQLWNELITGLAVIVLAACAASRKQVFLRWLLGTLGIWLLAAPLIFWARTKGAYDNGTIAGILLVLFALIIPAAVADTRSENPRAWSYNPSTWSQRLPIIALAMIGFFAARHMALFQLGYTSGVWEPFFGDGTRRVLESKIAKAFPISDAGLGAFSYLLDALAGAIGGTTRWRKMPWLVILFGIMIVPPGVTSIVLVILQPVGVGEWCTLCLFAAFMMLFMVAPAFDEVIATVQYLRQTRRARKSLWKTFWKGGEALNEPEKSEQSKATRAHRKTIDLALMNMVLSTGIGIWLMFVPAVLKNSEIAAANTYVLGALVTTFSVLALSQVLRSARLLNIAIGLWLLISPWVLGGDSFATTLNACIAGAVLICLSIPRGKIRKQFGGWNRFIV